MFYVLPMFSFPRPANYCDGEIGSFCNFVIGAESEDPYVKYRTTSQVRFSLHDLHYLLAKPQPLRWMNQDSEHGGVVAARSSSANYSCILRNQERPSKDDIDRMANNAKKYKAESEAVATRIAFNNGLES
ncbi:hypothetical protein Pst134EB_011030 [Puccinia striiformis f. sp. tritici]|nr:hypothetical protein Pst134EB_011030 [Puccinia striiformis f. sp. tritici]